MSAETKGLYFTMHGSPEAGFSLNVYSVVDYPKKRIRRISC